MSLDGIPKYLVQDSTTTYQIVGTPYTVDVISGPGRYRYYKTTKVNTPYFREEIRVDFEEVFEAANPDLQEYSLFNLDIFKGKKYI